jgi:hypothetical protein
MVAIVHSLRRTVWLPLSITTITRTFRMYRFCSSCQATDFSYEDRNLNWDQIQVENNKNSVKATNQMMTSVEASRECHVYELRLKQWTLAMSKAILI